MALLAAAKKPGFCRGRCLLEADGTLEIDASLLDTGTDNASFTAPLPTNLADQIFETMSPTPISAGNSLQASITQALPSDIATALIFNQSFPSDDFSLPPATPTGNISFRQQPAPVLYCPCNCTYISAACCLSQTRIVWEDLSEQVKMRPPPNNVTVCCDANNGKWMSTSTGCLYPSISSLNGSSPREGGFQALGTVRWNGSNVPDEIAHWQQDAP